MSRLTIPRNRRARVNMLLALVHFGNDYHGGGGSLAYQMMGRAAGLLRYHGVTLDGIGVLNTRMSPEVKAIYRRLVERQDRMNIPGRRRMVPNYQRYYAALPGR